MTLLGWIVTIVVVAIVAVLAYAATRPDELRVARSTLIRAPAEKIFPIVDDLRRWSAWSPWERKDPAMKRTFSGADRGKGAAYAWDGNRAVGSGRMEIVESTPPSKIAIKLDFIRPFEGHNTAIYTFVPEADATRLTWSMLGPSPFAAKVMGVFVDMDKMIGKDFEAGLANLKAAAEK